MTQARGRRIGEIPYTAPGFERAAYAAASARLRRPSFPRTLPTWCSTCSKAPRATAASPAR